MPVLNSRSQSRLCRLGVLLAAAGWMGGAVVGSARAGVTVPEFSSRPGAAYTVYLDLGGFDFNGSWGGGTPGFTAAYSLDGNANAFSAAEVASIQEIWSRVAEKYSALSVNVTTVDPAVAAGQAGSDAERQEFYDATPRLMHTVVGGTGSWFGGGGVSYVGVTQDEWAGSGGYHTNWVFAQQSPSNKRFIGEAIAHENGHGFGLWHQSDASGGNIVTEYSSNGTPTNGSYAGNGSYAPTMGVTYYTQRGLWRVGDADAGGLVRQNDFAVLGSNAGMTLVDDGVSHSMAAPTGMPLTGVMVNSALARGVITPVTLDDPNPMGVESYTKDYYSFFSLGGGMSLTCTDGAETMHVGVADPGATLDATLKIYNNAGVLVATGSRSADTLASTFTGTLPIGNYTVEVASIGGYQSTFDAGAQYFTGGSYFLGGNNVFSKYNLVGQSLVNAPLAGQDMTSANLTSANLSSAVLAGANLTGAIITSANFTFADLRGAVGFVPDQTTVTRGTILVDGSVKGFTFAPNESFRIRPGTVPVVMGETVTGPVSGTGTLLVDAGAVVLLSPGVNGAASVRTLNTVSVTLQGTSMLRSEMRSTTETATVAGRMTPATVAILSSLSMTNDGGAEGSRNYYGLLDLGTNDGIFLPMSLATLRDMARAFLASGGTQGIGSSSAIPNTRVAIVENTTTAGVAYFSTFDGVSVPAGYMLARFTYVGDTNLDGVLTGADLENVVEGISTGATGWGNGDFNYDGVVNALDLSAFNTAYAGFVLNPVSLGSPSGTGGTNGSVPEPGGAILAVGVSGWVVRRRR